MKVGREEERCDWLYASLTLFNVQLLCPADMH